MWVVCLVQIRLCHCPTQFDLQAFTVHLLLGFLMLLICGAIMIRSDVQFAFSLVTGCSNECIQVTEDWMLL